MGRITIAFVTYIIGFQNRYELEQFIAENSAKGLIFGDVYENMDEYPVSLEVRQELEANELNLNL